MPHGRVEKSRNEISITTRKGCRASWPGILIAPAGGGLPAAKSWQAIISDGLRAARKQRAFASLPSPIKPRKPAIDHAGRESQPHRAAGGLRDEVTLVDEFVEHGACLPGGIAGDIGGVTAGKLAIEDRHAQDRP